MSIIRGIPYTIILLVLVTSAGCEIKKGEEPYFVLVRPCVVEGSQLAGSTPAGGEIDQQPIYNYFFEKVDPLWQSAHIIFLPVVSKGNSNVPVIADPGDDSFDTGAISGQAVLNAEASDAALECAQAWEARGVSKGVVVVFARYLISDQLGFVYGVTDTVNRDLLAPNGSRSSDLCSAPRNLRASDLPAWTVVTGPGCTDPNCDTFARTRAHEALAHELGHVLLLGHGDGKDLAPSIGSAPPAAGPRPYDEYCDPDENDTELPCARTGLMNGFAGCTGLTELQIETARNAAEACSGGDFTCP